MLKYTSEKLFMSRWLNKPRVTPNISSHLPSLFLRKCPEEEEYQSRLKEELEIIEKSNFEKIFIQAALVVRSVDFQYICRGSAASSLVCFLLGITHIDPISNKMQFARFLNHKRNNQPDIDLDFPQNLREKVFEKIYDLFYCRVGHVINHLAWRERGATREALRLNKGEKNSSTAALAAKLLNTHKGDSLHCGGVVIFDDRVPEKFVNTCLKGKFVPKLNINKKETEEAGLVKLDILSNRGLSILNDLDSKRNICDYPADDPAVIKLLDDCDVIGITFVETPLVIKTMRIIKPRSPAELSLCLALVRPGPDKKRIIAQLNKCRNPDDLGLVYDDDVIEYISQILDVDVAEGDTMRKILSKNREEDWDDFEKKLLDRYPPWKAQQMIKNCGLVKRYTFCKSHSLNYAYMCWAMLWHKAHNPAKFWAAVLTHADSQYERWIYFRQAIEGGFDVELAKHRGKKWKTHKNRIYVSDTPQKQMQLSCFMTDSARWKQLEEYGFWVGKGFDAFFCDGEKFCGLIACSRRYKCDDGSFVSFVTIGVGEKKFFNITVIGKLDKRSKVLSGKGKKISEWEVYAGEDWSEY